ncbi:bifunctional lysylphosphatidylglycerol flippase/synthetase MprF [Curtobacterium sp. Curtsp57]|uniref:bifunctional lysylphosphatidylglycerol flippase/synthetase MprF n=1 Tax=Curtobacterium sp. Curtsp57 TaxID=3243047 RepID=UPI0039B3B88D
MTTVEHASRQRPRAAAVLTRIPGTLAVVGVLLVVGIVGQGLWSPTPAQTWWQDVAYGLPALRDGRWWTPVTGTFFVVSPAAYIPTVLAFAGMGLLEWRRGTRVALLSFGIGQLVAVLVTCAFLAVASLSAWPWADRLAGVLDVGPSGGAVACIAACCALLPSPWRQRLWVVVFGYAAISVLFLGTLADVEHAVAVLFALAVTRSFRIERATLRDRRLLAFAMSLALGAVQVISLLVPTDGPFGRTQALDGPWIDVLVDVVVIGFVTNGLRLGRRWAWVLTVLVPLLNIVTSALLVLVLAVDPGVQLDGDDAHHVVATSVLWLAFLVYLVATRSAFRSRRRRALGAVKGRRAADPPTLDEVRETIRADGGGTLSWMATWDGMEYLRTTTGVVPFQKHLGVAIVLADPLGPEGGIPASVAEFVAAAERDALVPCFFSAGTRTRDAVPPSWRSLVIADDTIVDLPGLAFTGKPWSHVRTALNRADREQVTFRMTSLAEETWGVRQQLRAISESWIGDKDLPEMRFTLGTLHEAEDPEVRLALAVSAVGDVEGFLSWLPVYGPGGEHRGWTLDLMRRRDGGFGPVMEFLIGSSARTFAEEGAQIMSLSGAPLAHEVGDDEGQIARLLGQLAGVLEPVYGFTSLHRFKQKFNPRYEPIHLLYRDEGDLARIGPALVRAFLPDATLRQYAAAGFDMIRRD